MKIPQEKTLSELCALRGVDRDSLELIGGGREDSDGIVYRTGDRVFKVISMDGDIEAAVKRADARLEFINYLGERGVSIAHPLKTERGIYSVCSEGDRAYMAYETPFVKGRVLTIDDFSDANVEKWGSLIGLTHRLTKDYPIWRNSLDVPDYFDWQGEIAGFENWRRDDEYCLSIWGDIRRDFEKLPIDRDCYGFIHNDAHQNNTFFDGERLTLIDFDCAGCNFFLHDFVTPLQGLLFERGWMFMPGKDRTLHKRFFESFVRGYERENHLSEDWLRRINLFIHYRRVLIYSCMVEYLDTVPELKDAARRIIAERPELIEV